MHPAAEAILYRSRTLDAAVEAYTAAEVAAGREEPTKEAATTGVWKVVAESEWAKLVAPELWAAFQEWLTCQRIADDAAANRVVRDGTSAKIEAIAADPFLYGEHGATVDLLPGRIRAYASIAAEVTRSEEALARARGRFVKSCYAYKARLDLVKQMTPAQQRAALMERVLIEDEKSIAYALISSQETPQTAVTILDDRARAARIAELIAKRKERDGS